MKRRNIIDFIRAFACLLVLFSHVRELYFGVHLKSSLYEYPFYFFTGLGHQAVIAFFIISGYLVGGNFINKHESLSLYFCKRLTRLYLVLIPTLIVSGIIITYIKSHPGWAEPFMETNSFNNGDFRTDIKTFILNIFFLHNSHCSNFAGNGPLWSVANEFWYYVLFPLIFYVCKKKSVISFFLCVIIIPFVGREIMIYFPLWLMGVLAFQLRGKIKSNFSATLVFILIVFSLLISKLHLFHLLISDFLIGLSISILLCINYDVKRVPKIIRFLSNSSYTIYLIHFPILTLIHFIYVQHNYTMDKYLSFFISTSIIIFLSTIFYNIFEKHTARTTKFLIKKLKIQ